MVQNGESRVAVYFDFDNIVISRYNLLYGQGAFHRDTARSVEHGEVERERLRESHLDIDAVLDYATTFGTLTLCRAYADWSHPVNASYRQDLTARAVDLVQLFPLSVRRKNGADIRLAVDAMEDLFLLPDVTHVVIVAGDSDYVALAQKVRRLGRYVVGIGVTGGTSRALTAACDEYADYNSLLTDEADEAEVAEATVAADAVATGAVEAEPKRATGRGGKGRASSKKPAGPVAQAEPVPDPARDADPEAEQEAEPSRVLARRRPGPLLRKALLLLEAKNNEEWQPASEVKNQMLRMDPSFQERELGSGTFSEFVKTYPGVAELDESGHNRIRRRPGSH